VARMGEKRNAYGALVGRPEGKIPLGRRRSRWEDNVKIGRREIPKEGVNWIDMAQKRDKWWSVNRQ